MLGTDQKKNKLESEQVVNKLKFLLNLGYP